MSFDDTRKALTEHRSKELDIFQRLLAVVRHLEPQLRDLNANHSADRLAALLSEYDSSVARLQATVASNPDQFIEFLISAMGPTPPGGIG